MFDLELPAKSLIGVAVALHLLLLHPEFGAQFSQIPWRLSTSGSCRHEVDDLLEVPSARLSTCAQARGNTLKY